MTALDRRLTRVQAALPPPPPPPRVHDLSRLTPAQRARYAHLSARFQAVGLSGLTDAELVEIAELVTVLERES